MESRTIILYWPVNYQEGYINPSNLFGARPEVYAQFGLDKGHNGLDFIINEGKPIYASHDGNLEFFEDKTDQGYYGYGKYAVITHPEGYKTYYAHQLAFTGKPRFVRAGEQIGLVDSTGFSTGNHLHFTFKPANPNYNNGYRGAEDPTPYLADEKERPNMNQFKTQNYKGELRIVLQASTPEEWKALCRVYGVDPALISETIQ